MFLLFFLRALPAVFDFWKMLACPGAEGSELQWGSNGVTWTSFVAECSVFELSKIRATFGNSLAKSSPSWCGRRISNRLLAQFVVPSWKVFPWCTPLSTKGVALHQCWKSHIEPISCGIVTLGLYPSRRALANKNDFLWKDMDSCHANRRLCTTFKICDQLNCLEKKKATMWKVNQKTESPQTGTERQTAQCAPTRGRVNPCLGLATLVDLGPPPSTAPHLSMSNPQTNELWKKSDLTCKLLDRAWRYQRTFYTTLCWTPPYTLTPTSASTKLVSVAYWAPPVSAKIDESLLPC